MWKVARSTLPLTTSTEQAIQPVTCGNATLCRVWPVTVGDRPTDMLRDAASSSRSQVAAPTASTVACLTWEPSSVGVRWRPLLAKGVVTHLVTRFRGSFCLTSWMLTTGAFLLAVNGAAWSEYG